MSNETVGTAAAGGPAIYGLLAELRKKVGVLLGAKKEGVKFKVRSAEVLNDRIRKAAQELGILIYPTQAYGKGYPLDSGTLAEVNLTLRIQAISDQSYIDVMGFGLGADSQDKAGGKAGTYAWKSALVQTLLAGGAEDTDDSDTPIPGGVKKKGPGVKTTVAMVTAALDAANTMEGWDAALKMARNLTMDEQRGMADSFKAARSRLTPATPAQN